ncbi:MAG: efflux RND transporter periplasmic adaptor subunit [Deltaproteobacteria bacterium]|nr:MAG: efflux RND transporter periplasmic adaptor subunit [Deltaproteobacteria bacterium]
MRGRRWTAVSLAALALGAAACSQESSGPGIPPAAGPGAPPREPLPAIAGSADRAAAPAAANVTTGTTFPIRSAQIGPNMSGVIAKLPVDEGDRVRKGDLLFRLRTTDLSLRVQQAKAALDAARVRLDAAKREYDRTRRLFDNNAVDQATWERVQAEYDGARAGVAAAEAALAVANQALADASVRSPIDGVVTRRFKNVGEMVTMMPPTVVLVVEDHSELELRFNLPTRVAAHVKVGDPVTARFDVTGATRVAEVSRISPNVDPRTRTVEVTARLHNEDGALKAGMLAKVELRDGGAAENAR